MKRKFLTPVFFLLFLCPFARAQIVYSGVQDIAIPSSVLSDGVFIDVDGLSSQSSTFSGWDIQLFGGGSFIRTSEDFLPLRAGNLNTERVINLAPGTLIDSSSQFFVDSIGVSTTHLQTNPDQFFIGQPGYLGFELTPNGTTASFIGWMKVTLGNTADPGIVHEWAYNASGGGIMVGAIPEPSTYALIFGGVILVAVFIRRFKIQHSTAHEN